MDFSDDLNILPMQSTRDLNTFEKARKTDAKIPVIADVYLVKDERKSNFKMAGKRRDRHRKMSLKHEERRSQMISKIKKCQEGTKGTGERQFDEVGVLLLCEPYVIAIRLYQNNRGL